MMVKLRNLVLFFMLLTVVAHILLYTDPAASFKTPFSKRDFLEDVTALVRIFFPLSLSLF
jgi:alpha-1,4-galacturonosyltransferase